MRRGRARASAALAMTAALGGAALGGAAPGGAGMASAAQVAAWPGGVARAVAIERAGATARTAGAVPVVLIVMENEQFASIVGNPNAPFINHTMIAGGVLDTDYLAAPGSLPDYLEITSGQRAPASSAPNLFAALGTAVPWREFMESMPWTCYKGSSYQHVNGTGWGLYTRYHNPAVQFTSVSATPLCKDVVPLTPASFTPDALPAFSLVVPNECDDMHTLPADRACPTWTGTVNTAPDAVRMGDNWLASFVPTVARHATVILTWDEGSSANERVATVLYGLGVTPGTDATAYTHASLEAGLYAYYGLGIPPGDGATAPPLPIP